METPDLTDPDYWESESPDLRSNPAGASTEPGMDAFVAGEPRLSGHVLVATSGSGGEPKWIALSRAALLASAGAVNRHLEVGGRDRWLCALPTFHVGGIGVFARAHAAGIPVVTFDGRWKGRAPAFVEACRDHRITLTSLAPTQVHDLVTEGRTAPPSLRAVIVGGGRLDPELGGAARALGWPVLASYGMTEAASQVATEGLEALDSPFAGEWLPVLDGWEVSTTPEDGRARIRGAALFSGTVTRTPGAGWRFDPVPLEAGGCFSTADRVELRPGEGGRTELRFLGRSDDLVKKLGELVSLDRLRSRFTVALRRHGLAGTVIALPDDRSGCRLVAVFEGTAEGDERAAACVAALDEAGAPFERIDLVRHLDRLPRTALGKIALGELERRLSAGDSAGDDDRR